jgi:molecular chaperone DnaK
VSNHINFGIDLGTTNSGLALYDGGKVTIFKNPVGFRDTIPSVVSFRKGRIQIGEKAREHLASNTGNVFSSFKRKMGSDESYFVPDIDKSVTPIELSSMILKELLTFAQGHAPQTCVITIPASFDTIQSNATKKAGYQAGLKEVVLLQEPIAACLAYSNAHGQSITDEKKWLVYDFGGGTFDAALVSINARELNVISHKGNNFLGGVDLDNLVVEKILCPKLEQAAGLTGLWNKMVSGNDLAMKKLYFEMLFKAEEAKKELSLKDSVTIEIDIDEPEISAEIDISKSEFEQVLEPKFEETYQLVEKLIRENSVRFSDIERIILVGGTTYIPYIREELQRRSGVLVDSGIDPTTAVLAGAAYYAGAKPSTLEVEASDDLPTFNSDINLNLIYEPHSKDSEELVAGIIENPFSGYYRLVRGDGSFDTGVLKMAQRFSEFLPLLPKTTNLFTLYLYDENQLQVHSDTIRITNGLYNISGQPLPNDICLELDESSDKTMLERIFRKNDILPLKKTIYKTCSKNILKNSDDKLVINIVEGNAGGMIGSNLSIGYIEISGCDFQQDLLKGMDIELNFKISESRDLSINVYISSLDLEINEVFNPHERTVSVEKLRSEIKEAMDEIQDEIYREQADENFEYLSKLKRCHDHLAVLYNEAAEIADDHSTDKKYQIDEMKRLSIQEYDDLVRHKHVLNELQEYQSTREMFESYLEKASPKQRDEYEKIIRNEKEILESGNKYLIRKKNKELDDLLDDIYHNQEERYIDIYYYLKFFDASEFKDPGKFKKLCDLGEKAIDKQNYPELRSICNQMWTLLINKPKNRDDLNSFDGNLGLK